MEMKKLYKSLSQRKRPEDIAEIIISVLGNDLNSAELQVLEKAAKGSLKRQLFSYTSMMQEFSAAVGAEKQIKKAIEIFKLEDVNEIDYNYVPDIKGFIDEVSPLIHKDVGNNNFLADRLNKSERKEIGLDISKRNYNKKWRLLKRLEKKLLKFQREIRKVEFQKIAKHGIVHHLDFENFSKNKNTACFIAYYNSKCNLRSVFTNKSQARAFDEISNMLYKRCTGKRTIPFSLFGRKKSESMDNQTNWLAISYIYPNQEVLTKLTDNQKGQLLGKWTNIIQDIAQLLKEIWSHSSIRRETMIVQRGNDSTTWNNTAGAWNKARDNWMNLIHSMGMNYILDEICFGKVMRLMAADVVAWHCSSGGKLDPNTEVWNKLPLPWEVFEGKEKCNKNLVIKYCKDAGLDAEKSGWVAPRKHRVEKFKPTPELVHGVEVSNPFLATALKRHKYFSGKKVKYFYPENN